MLSYWFPKPVSLYACVSEIHIVYIFSSVRIGRLPLYRSGRGGLCILDRTKFIMYYKFHSILGS